MKPYQDWFAAVTTTEPYSWQLALGTDTTFHDRLLRVPTGFGKTAGTALAWLYHRCVRNDPTWPRRLVFTLPMRVLVEQTERALQQWVAKAGLDVPVAVLLGGRESMRWLDDLDSPVVLIGTQDMLLSRALNRGYASGRALWPMEMGALHSDVLWVVDEVQLMDTGLASTTQLAAFRAQDAAAGKPVYRPARTWWMSATLQPSWLESIDFRARVETLPQTRLAPSQRSGGLWDVRKRIDLRADATTPEELAKLAFDQHRDHSLTLVIVNTVKRANKAAAELAKLCGKSAKAKGPVPELRTVHSRFRGHERQNWTFLTRDANRPENLPQAGRIVVATQVVEAGVDVSARLLVTELAPWSSLVQRFGRCARYAGEGGQIVVAGAPPTSDSDAAPYELAAVCSAAEALRELAKGEADAGPRSLEAFEEALPPTRLAELYPYCPTAVLRRPDFDELFDTSADLSGADLDVGRYIRSGDDRDVSVFWREVDTPPDSLTDTPWPSRDELCPVPAHEFREFLKGNTAYAFDYVKSAWRKQHRDDRVVPGVTFLVPAKSGGYVPASGWDAGSKANVTPVPVAHATDCKQRMVDASLAGDDDALAVAEGFKTIRLHGHETANEAMRLGAAFGLPAHLVNLLALAGRWHDAGKAHGVFQDAIRTDARTGNAAFGRRRDLAKAPQKAFAKPPYAERPGFRHELASTLMMFELVRRRRPDHPGLLGPHREVLTALGQSPVEVAPGERLEAHPLADELAALSAEDLDLVAYLVCAHHGKVRGRWATTPRDMEAGLGAIHGVVDGRDVVGAVDLPLATGAAVEVPTLTLSLSMAAIGLGPKYGASWTDRVQGLLQTYGPFSLAFLETVLRLADWRASRLPAEVLP